MVYKKFDYDSKFFFKLISNIHRIYNLINGGTGK